MGMEWKPFLNSVDLDEQFSYKNVDILIKNL